jgi:lipopolysaccharide/colanic/teichoic acid biosynthesis glycosyltransferase
MKRVFQLKDTETFGHFRISKGKRLFDIVFSLIALLLFSPIMIIVAILVKLESKGPVIYASQRIGTGYDIFKFYKFRSMRQGSDEELSKISELNLYLINKSNRILNSELNCPECSKRGEKCSPVLYIEGTEICENWYFELKRRRGSKTTFFKAKDDPRVTRVGKVIRRFNLDELPQLYNVLKGDMSDCWQQTRFLLPN